MEPTYVACSLHGSLKQPPFNSGGGFVVVIHSKCLKHPH